MMSVLACYSTSYHAHYVKSLLFQWIFCSTVGRLLEVEVLVLSLLLLCSLSGTRISTDAATDRSDHITNGKTNWTLPCGFFVERRPFKEFPEHGIQSKTVRILYIMEWNQ